MWIHDFRPGNLTLWVKYLRRIRFSSLKCEILYLELKMKKDTIYIIVDKKTLNASLISEKHLYGLQKDLMQPYVALESASHSSLDGLI